MKTPIIAGGGIVDERGVAAAFVLGAEGVYMGTRFMATVECIAHARVNQAVLSATDKSTVAFARRTGLSRWWRNEYTNKHIDLEAEGASFEELRNYEYSCPSIGGWRRVAGALIAGNIDKGSLPMGAGAGMIEELFPAGEVVSRLIRNYHKVIERIACE